MDIIKTENVAEKKQKQLIYELMIGLYDLKQVQFPESKIVEDEYAEGKPSLCRFYRGMGNIADHSEPAKREVSLIRQLFYPFNRVHSRIPPFLFCDTSNSTEAVVQ